MKRYLLLKNSAGRFGLIDFCVDNGIVFEWRAGGSYSRAIINEEQATILKIKCPIIALRPLPIPGGMIRDEWLHSDEL